MCSLEVTSSIPLYVQIQHQIRNLIETGNVRLGGRLPSETELASQFGVSRMTVRQALDELASEQLVTRKRGVGTFVTDSADVIAARLAFPPSLSSLLSEAGYTSNSEVLARTVTTDIPSWGAELLELEEGEPVAYTERLRFADDIPLAINRSWLPDKLVPGLIEIDFIGDSLVKTLVDVYQLLPTKGIEWVEPTMSRQREANLLNIEQGTPLLLMTTISRLADDTPVEFSKTLWRGDRLRLQINSRDFVMTFREGPNQEGLRIHEYPK